MARTLDHAARSIGRDAILDAAEELIRTRGYEQVSVQDVQDRLGASRGAIYHYFDSKDDLLAAVVDRMADAIWAALDPVASDPDLSATAKLQTVFVVAGRWKAERSDVLLGLLRAWYSAENDLVRSRLSAAAFSRLEPILARVVTEGVAAKEFTPTWPAATASILVALLIGSADPLGHLLVDRREARIPFEQVERWMAAYSEAVERILGLAPGAFTIVEPATLRAFFD